MLTKEEKKAIFTKHGKAEKNTGSAEVQIAMFTTRIIQLTEHMEKSKKDKVTQRSLINLVGKRKSLLDYLRKSDLGKYRALIKELDIRK